MRCIGSAIISLPKPGWSRKTRAFGASTPTMRAPCSRRNSWRRKTSSCASLLAIRDQLAVQSVASEILYDTRDPFTRKIVLDRGSRDGVAAGQPVIDDAGVVGQVTRVFPFAAEVSLVDRQGPGDSGAGAAQRFAQRGLRPRPVRPAGTAFHGGQRRHPQRRRAGHFRHRRRLSAGAGGGARDPGRKQGDRCLCPYRVRTAGRARPPPPVAGVADGGQAVAADRGRAKGRTEAARQPRRAPRARQEPQKIQAPPKKAAPAGEIAR